MQTPPTKSYNIPDEFQKFVSEYQELLRKHPKAATRFGLVDLGNNHVQTRVCKIDCVEVMGITICEIKEREQ